MPTSLRSGNIGCGPVEKTSELVFSTLTFHYICSHYDSYTGIS